MKKPNILFIMPDQQRYDCIGYSNRYPVKTPNIDSIARDGVWFNRAYTPMPLCCPARQSLLNCRRPERFGSYWNYDFGGMVGVLDPKEYSWPRSLQEAGYATGYAGKWHVHPDYDPTFYGFDEYWSDEAYFKWRMENHPEADLSGWFPESDEKDGFRNWIKFFKGAVDQIDTANAKTHWHADKVIDMIRRANNSGKPWHIRMDFYEPHLPCLPSPEFMEMYDPASIPQWKSFPDPFEDKPYIQKQQLYNWGLEDYTWEDWAPIVARYYASITQTDDAIGKVLRALDEMGIADDTMVVYVPDHGDMCGGHGMMDKQYNMYEDIVHVPMCIRYPRGIKPGTVVDEFVYSCLDIGPTILDYAGIESQLFFEGRSLRPLLEGNHPEDWRQEIVSTYNGMQFGLYTERMLLIDGWKYIWNTTDVDELYDMNHDPDELCNLIHRPEHAELVQSMRKRLYGLLKEQNDFMGTSFWMGYQLLNNKKL